MASPHAKRPFPRKEESFSEDDRIAFDNSAGTYILEDHDGDGKIYEWNARAQNWAEQISDEQVHAFQSAYGGAQDSDERPRSPDNANDSNKRKRADDDTQGANADQGNNKKQKQQKKNSGLYIKNVPKDVTVDELHETFSKYGVIAESIDDRTPRIKIYYNDDGTPKGDALVVYHRPESVDLAIEMLDETDFRYGQKLPAGPMILSLAEKSYKKTDLGDAEKKEQSEPRKAKKKGGLSKDQHKAIKVNEKLDSKLADWSDDEPQELKLDPRKAKVVILSNVFKMSVVQKDPQEATEIKEDMLDEAEKFGEVTSVTIWDLEEDGIVTIRFKDEGCALACVNKMRGRYFGGLVIEASLGTGREKFQKMKKAAMAEDQEERLEAMAAS